MMKNDFKPCSLGSKIFKIRTLLLLMEMTARWGEASMQEYQTTHENIFSPSHLLALLKLDTSV